MAIENPHPLPYEERHIPYEQRKGASIWPDDARMSVNFYIAAEEWEWDKPEYGPPFRNTKRDEVGRTLSTRSGVKFGFDIGLRRLNDILEKHDYNLTIFTTGNAIEQHPEPITELYESGHEIAGHGYSEGTHPTVMDRDEQREDIRKSVEIIEDHVGERPVGWLGPGAISGEDTVELLAEEGFLYQSDLQDDEIPYFIDVGGNTIVETSKRIVGNVNDYYLPMARDYRMPIEETLQYLIGVFDTHYRLASQTPLLFNYGIHPYVSGRADGAYILDEFLDHIRKHDDVWLTTYKETSEWWMDQYDDGYDV